jgi:hypothetical protein
MIIRKPAIRASLIGSNRCDAAGLTAGLVRSALQKYIRRGRYEDAMRMAAHMKGPTSKELSGLSKSCGCTHFRHGYGSGKVDHSKISCLTWGHDRRASR